MKIMILADVHIRNKVSPERQERTFKALKTAFSDVKCDLAVFLGDLVHGPDYEDDRDSYIADYLSSGGQDIMDDRRKKLCSSYER